MAASSTSRDPRSIVTPEAFEVSQELLGLPLASARRRLAAILLDLVFVGIVTVLTRSVALVLGVLVAGALLRAGFVRTQVTGNVFDRARRASVGCLGLMVGLVTFGIFVARMVDDEPSGADDPSRVEIDLGTGSLNIQRQATAGDPLEARDAQAVRDGVTLYSFEQALERYAALRQSGGQGPMDQELLLALEARLAAEVASDTLLALETRITELAAEARDSEERLDEAEAELDQALSRGVLGWLSGLLDDLGFGFGWAALYMTVWMSVTNGQTLGKRMLGIRVVRLDGRRINWWVAFERAGGYAAGFATGLLGFAQILWDANRQAIHDRIAGTVVVREGLDRVLDLESAT
jgi:hypothetical protein